MLSSVLTGLAFLFLSLPAIIQAPADFSGTWSLPPDAPTGPNGKPVPAPGFGPQINIRQDATSVTISKVFGAQTVHVVHPLDGSESRSRTPGRLCEGDSHSIWTATRKDNTIETQMIGSLPPGATTPTKSNVRTVFRLVDADTLASHAELCIDRECRSLDTLRSLGMTLL